MKLTKYGHACLLIEDKDKKLIIDPGSYTDLPETIEGIKVIVITHEHGDHVDPDLVERLVKDNPETKILTTASVASTLADKQIKAQAITGQSQLTCGGFKLRFEEVDHSIIYGKSPCNNLSVGVDDFLYYPGDSFAGSQDSYQVLALPISGPWFDLRQAIDLTKSFRAKYVVGTHDGHLNQRGSDSTYSWLERFAGEGREMVNLSPGQSRDFD